MKKIVLICFLCLLSVSVIAQDKDFKPEVKVGGLVITGFQFNIDDADFTQKLDLSSPNSALPFGYAPMKNQFEINRNSFYLERAYININAKLTPQISARLTPDIYSSQDNSGKTQWSYQVKFAYVDYTPVLEDNGLSLGFQIGVIPNMWVNYAERYYTYRFVQKTYTDYTWTTNAKRDTSAVSRSSSSFFSTADLGLTAKFTFPHKYADLYLSILNGNGFRDLSFDQSRLKDIMISGFIYPLSGYLKEKMELAKKSNKTRIDGVSDLIVGGFAYMGSIGSGNNTYTYNRYGGMMSFRFNFDKFGFFRLGGEYSVRSQSVASMNDSTVNAGGFSSYLEFNPPVEVLNEKLTLLARYDIFDPNTNKPGINAYGLNADNGKQNMLILGIFYKPSTVLTFGVSYQRVGYEKDFVVKYDGTVKNSVDRLFFNTLLNF